MLLKLSLPALGIVMVGACISGSWYNTKQKMPLVDHFKVSNIYLMFPTIMCRKLWQISAAQQISWKHIQTPIFQIWTKQWRAAHSIVLTDKFAAHIDMKSWEAQILEMCARMCSSEMLFLELSFGKINARGLYLTLLVLQVEVASEST